MGSVGRLQGHHMSARAAAGGAGPCAPAAAPSPAAPCRRQRQNTSRPSANPAATGIVSAQRHTQLWWRAPVGETNPGRPPCCRRCAAVALPPCAAADDSPLPLVLLPCCACRAACCACPSAGAATRLGSGGRKVCSAAPVCGQRQARTTNGLQDGASIQDSALTVGE